LGGVSNKNKIWWSGCCNAFVFIGTVSRALLRTSRKLVILLRFTSFFPILVCTTPEECVSKFGSGYQESIITKKKGKLDHNEPLQSLASSQQGMKSSTDKYYQVKELMIYNVVTIIIREYLASSKNELLNIRLLNTYFCKDDTQAPMMAPDRLFCIT
jgi:hypothetical protein